jgi:hypothetical protein
MPEQERGDGAGIPLSYRVALHSPGRYLVSTQHFKLNFVTIFLTNLHYLFFYYSLFSRFFRVLPIVPAFFPSALQQKCRDYFIFSLSLFFLIKRWP